MLTGTNNEQKIWNYLRTAGMSACGAAGVMGNLYAESGLNPQNLQQTYEKKLGYTDASYTAAVDNGSYTNFVRDSAGYGLAQWTYWSRKENLLNFAKGRGASVGDLETQLAFLVKELGQYGLLNGLKTVGSVREASNTILLQFEKPASKDTKETQDRRAGYAQGYYDKYGKTTTAAPAAPAAPVTTGKPAWGNIKTGRQLAEAALYVARNFKTLYVMGCFGAPMTAANKKRYTQNHEYNRQAARTRMIQAATEDTFGFDCVCLIKGLLWGWRGDKGKSYGGAGYACNNVPDIGADQMIAKCKDVSTDFSRLEIGEAVWCKGHIGVYVGGGLAVECTPAWKNCVQVTACNCTRSGYDRRNWTKHGRLPYVTYTGERESLSGTATATPATAAPAAPAAQATAPVKVDPAYKFDRTLAGAYKTTAKLNLRAGASTDRAILIVMPKGAVVRNYGYYNVAKNGVKWLYVQYFAGGKTYTGFCSSNYLKK